MSFEVRTEQFNGPMHKLLELIESKEMDVAQVSLAQVTGDFIAYVEQMNEGVSSVILSEFVVVASRLLLIKSKILIPNLEFSEEEEADIADLERRLKIYRELCSMNPATFKTSSSAELGVNKSAAFYISEIWNKNSISYSRRFLLSLKDRAVFYPPENTDGKMLEEAMRRVVNALEKILPERVPVEDNIVTLQEKIEDLVGRLAAAGKLTFNGSFKEEEKAEIVVLFLAVLHMLGNRLASVNQDEDFGEIKVAVNKV
ncbi:MAG: hypothetical protein COU10_00540 [Candidatus Harrisonbacteria bacterium CG10_big_fil_rev_8_21_14_0_10_45_28]|uniref:Segregation and condensation protein A n=1 Tax=Candidatus Harrisonbacteria bacterium CG10_big_fil_rev_8_21_14_0_10_45_28 TaxID=1974586 RepID=A0A2H0UQY1_9BACT|nr:MAG: hypothetical protein COU10_00540 [Candidatus Harrisonbacteria bacterium CG10_big_fil_rev_8_21_14_0_10_45_28]